MRAMADVPWPARQFKTPATAAAVLTNRRCTRIVTHTQHRRPGWRGMIDRLRRRKPVTREHGCGGYLLLVPASNERRRGRLVCPRCNARTRQVRRTLNQMFGNPRSARRGRH